MKALFIALLFRAILPAAEAGESRRPVHCFEDVPYTYHCSPAWPLLPNVVTPYASERWQGAITDVPCLPRKGGTNRLTFTEKQSPTLRSSGAWTLQTTQSESRYITVMGEVREPMRIRTDRRLKLTKIIAFCGGLTANADDRKIVVFGARGIATFDLRRVENSSRDPFIELGETVYVKDR